MNRVLRYTLLISLVVIIFWAGIGGGVILDRQVLLTYLPPKTASDNTTIDFNLLSEAWNLINQVYVDRSAVQPNQLTYGAISGMVDALGDTGHSRFLTPQMVKEENSFTQGQFEGIGVEVEQKNGNLVIVAPIDGSPAQQAGLRAGEIILKVNGKSIEGLPLDQVVQLILGPSGTQVTITIQDPTTGNTQDVQLTRARIVVHNVTWERIPGTTIAHLRIAAFSDGVSADLQKALQEIQQQGMTGIILDLRNDPGGLLQEAVGVTSQFISSGNVLLEKDAQGKVTPVPVQPKGPVTRLSVIVLINQGTASAAEIVAGALQDAQRAKLVGETTFGTGTVLNQFNLGDGSALLLATEEWLTPNGRLIWHQGIKPDETVTLASNQNLLVPEAEKQMTAAQLQASGDGQLLDAIKLLPS
jgi:carboxyl-terminal processing protease